MSGLLTCVQLASPRPQQYPITKPVSVSTFLLRSTQPISHLDKQTGKLVCLMAPSEGSEGERTIELKRGLCRVFLQMLAASHKVVDGKALPSQTSTDSLGGFLHTHTLSSAWQLRVVQL